MGYTFAYELGSAVAGTNGFDRLNKLRLEIAVEQHLQYNFYPPIPLGMTDPCCKAINACLEDDPERMIVTGRFEHKRYGAEVPAHAIVDACRLEGFVDAMYFCVEEAIAA